MFRERQVSVFDEPTLLEPSQMGTWTMEVDVADEQELESLLAPLEGTVHEDWTANLQTLCAACSLGLPDGHDHGDRPDAGWKRRRFIGVAAPSEESFAPLKGFLGRWRRGVVSLKREL